MQAAAPGSIFEVWCGDTHTRTTAHTHTCIHACVVILAAEAAAASLDHHDVPSLSLSFLSIFASAPTSSLILIFLFYYFFFIVVVVVCMPHITEDERAELPLGLATADYTLNVVRAAAPTAACILCCSSCCCCAAFFFVFRPHNFVSFCCRCRLSKLPEQPQQQLPLPLLPFAIVYFQVKCAKMSLN